MNLNAFFLWASAFLLTLGAHADEKMKVLPYAPELSKKDFSGMLGCYYASALKSNVLFPSMFRLSSMQITASYYKPNLLYYTYRVDAMDTPMGLYWRFTGVNEFSIGSNPGSFAYDASFVKVDVNSWHTVFRASDDVGHKYEVEATYEKLSKRDCVSGEVSKKIRRYCCVPSGHR